LASRNKPVRQAPTLPIGKLSTLTGCNIETIRYYERIKILPAPPRSAAGQRVYDESHLKRLQFVRRARELGFPLDRIRELLAMEDGGVTTCGEVQRITLDHLAEICRKIADLRRLERTLRDTAAKCAGGAMPECPVIETLAKPALRAPR
jgi:MerR family mercuric resistance operon transcriptional regulator